MGAVDRPGEHPELWTDDERSMLKTVSDAPPADAEEPLSLDETPQAQQMSWWVTFAVIAGLLLLALLLSQLRRM